MTAEEIERYAEKAAGAQRAYDEAYQAKARAEEACGLAFAAWEEARARLERAVGDFVRSKLSSNDGSK